MANVSSFESLGLHPVLLAALQHIGAPCTPFLSRVLDRTATDFADLLVDSRSAASGHAGAAERHMLLALFALHGALSARQSSRLTALLIARGMESAEQLHERLRVLAAHCRVEVRLCVGKRQRLPEETLARMPRVVVVTPATLGRFDSDNNNNNEDSDSNNGEYKNDNNNADDNNNNSGGDETFLRGVAAVAVEDVVGCGESFVDAVLRAAAARGGQGTSIGARCGPHVMLLCSGPLKHLSPTLRGRLCRHNRRYYHFDPHTVDKAPSTASGTLPPVSNRVVYVLYLDERDRESLLRRVLHIHKSRRVVLLTHHKEIRHTLQTIKGWGAYMGEEDFVGSILRNDAPERQESTMANFLREPNKKNNGEKAAGSSLLVAWDAFTAVDLLDVDLFIQYYPPQKSLTCRESAEFVQVLHTTADPEPATHGRRTMLLTFLALSDFTLAAFFMQQYGQRGHVLNIAPHHPAFEQCLANPAAVLRIKQQKERERRGGQQKQPQLQQTDREAHVQVSAPLPLPRSMRHRLSETV